MGRKDWGPYKEHFILHGVVTKRQKFAPMLTPAETPQA